MFDRSWLHQLFVFERETDLVPVGVHNLSSSIKTKETRNKTCSFSIIFNFCLRLKLYKLVNFVAFQTCKQYFYKKESTQQTFKVSAKNTLTVQSRRLTASNLWLGLLKRIKKALCWLFVPYCLKMFLTFSAMLRILCTK